MIDYDMHMHTSFSSDSETDPEDQVRAAIALGAKGLCFTDHMDYHYPCADIGGRTFVFDAGEYMDRMCGLRKKYRGRIDILIGMELGLRNEPDETAYMKEMYGRLLDEYDLDFTIGSTHCLEHTDPYYGPYWEGDLPKNRLRDYFEACLQNMKTYDCFDTSGHYDYCLRYVPKSEQWSGISDYDPADFMDITDEFLKTLIAKGKALECNTAAIKYGFPCAHPHDMVLKRYLELGGELLTIGSDGHRTEHIFYEFGRICEHLKALGFRYYTIYRHHRPEFLPL